MVAIDLTDRCTVSLKWWWGLHASLESGFLAIQVGPVVVEWAS